LGASELNQDEDLCCVQVREKEADSDGLIGPVEDMYALLGRYEVRLPAEELTAVSDLRYSWRKLLDLASATSNTLSQLQVIHSLLQCSLISEGGHYEFP
jgi:hypothetical protein